MNQNPSKQYFHAIQCFKLQGRFHAIQNILCSCKFLTHFPITADIVGEKVLLWFCSYAKEMGSFSDWKKWVSFLCHQRLFADFFKCLPTQKAFDYRNKTSSTPFMKHHKLFDHPLSILFTYFENTIIYSLMVANEFEITSYSLAWKSRKISRP